MALAQIVWRIQEHTGKYNPGRPDLLYRDTNSLYVTRCTGKTHYLNSVIPEQQVAIIIHIADH